MKKSVKILGISIGVLVGLAVIASVAVSLVVDPVKYKPELEKAFADATGYKLAINGDIGVSLFPLPKAYVKGVAVSNGSKRLVEIEQINIYPQILPLLSGEKKISSITVKSPMITLEKSATGENWAKSELEPVGAPSAPAGAKIAAPKVNISIDKIEIENGKMQYANLITGQSHVLDKININASLASANGPLNLDGNIEYNGLPLKLKTSVNNFTDPKIFADIETKQDKIKFDGTKLGGKLVLSSTDLGPLLNAAHINNKIITGRAVSFDGNIKYENKIVTITNSKFALGNTSGNVSLAAQLGANDINATVNLALAKLDIDELLAAQKDATKPEASASPADANNKEAPTKIHAEINAGSEQLIYKTAVYKKLSVIATVDDDTITLRPFSIQTPGQGSVESFGVLSKTTRGWDFDGNVAANAANLREMVTAITGNKLDNINPKGLKNFDIQTNVTASITSAVNTINLSGMKMVLDESNINGAVTVKTEKPTAISFKGSIDKLNLNNYSSNKVEAQEGTSGGLKGNKKLDFEWLKTLPVNADITATIGSVTNKDKTYTSIRIDGTAKPGDINFKEFSANLQTFSVGAIVSLNVNGQRPKFNVDANIDKIKLSDLTKTPAQPAATAAPAAAGGKWSESVFNFSPMDQVDGSIRAKIGSIAGNKLTFSNVSVTGRLIGGEAHLDNFYSDVLGGSINMNGELIMSAVPSIKVNVSAENIDLAAAAQGLFTSWPISGRTSLNGSFTSAGVHQKAMVDNLNGNASVNATNINVRGLDLASFGYNIVNTNDPLAIVALLKNVSGGSKTTQMNSVGTIFAEKGVLKTTGMQVQSDAAQGTVSGYMDLAKWYMDADAKFNMASTGSDKKSPAFGVHLYGSPDALKKEYDTKELEKYIGEKGILSQKKIDLLKPGGLENKINDKLMKQLGIKAPAAVAPAPDALVPAPTSAAPAPAAVVPAAAAPDAAAQPEPTDKQKLKDAKKQLLNQGLQQLLGH